MKDYEINFSFFSYNVSQLAAWLILKVLLTVVHMQPQLIFNVKYTSVTHPHTENVHCAGECIKSTLIFTNKATLQIRCVQD